MSQNDSKHVQTELSVEDYETFRELARKEEMTVKEASREALRSWVERHRRTDPNDRTFTALDELDERGTSAGTATDARQESDVVDDWSGTAVEFRLAPEPSPRD